MKQYQVFESDGGYRYAGDICWGLPVLNRSPWYKTKKIAQYNARRAFQKRFGWMPKNEEEILGFWNEIRNEH